jgi:hypothetical protein
VAFGSAFALVACEGPRTAPADVIYESGANDEAWLEIEAATPIVDDARAARLLRPDRGVVVDGPAVTFEWDGGAVAEGVTARVLPRAAFGRRLFDRVVREVIPVARAHGPPANGPIYRLELRFEGSVDPVRVLTGRTSYTPGLPVWERIREARRTHGVVRMQVQIVSAFFMTGRIAEGPYTSTAPAVLTLE